MNPIGYFKSYIRSAILRKKFSSSVIYPGACLDRFSVLGECSVLFRDVAFINSTLGAYSYVQAKSVVCNAEIGKFCSIASNVYIGLASHPTHMASTSPIFFDNSQPLPRFFGDWSIFSEKLPFTKIGADVWIGHGAMFKAGVVIGVGAVIGAGSVVTKDIPPYSIAAGNPCKVIKYRFSQDIINRLMLTEWWMRGDDELKRLSRLFVDPLKLLERLED